MSKLRNLSSNPNMFRQAIQRINLKNSVPDVPFGDKKYTYHQNLYILYLFGNLRTRPVQQNHFQYVLELFLNILVTSVNIDLPRTKILHVTYSQYMKELINSVTSVDIELLYMVLLYVTQSHYMKKLSMTVISVNIELLSRVILYVTYSQNIKDLSMSVTSMNIELLHRVILL